MTSLGVKMVPFDAHVVVDEEADSNESNTVEKILSRFEVFSFFLLSWCCQMQELSRRCFNGVFFYLFFFAKRNLKMFNALFCASTCE